MAGRRTHVRGPLYWYILISLDSPGLIAAEHRLCQQVYLLVILPTTRPGLSPTPDTAYNRA